MDRAGHLPVDASSIEEAVPTTPDPVKQRPRHVVIAISAASAVLVVAAVAIGLGSRGSGPSSRIASAVNPASASPASASPTPGTPGTSPWPAATPPTMPIGDRVGIRFLATMHRAYLDAPGVQLSVVSRGSTHADFGDYLLQLGGGTVVAEAFIGSGGDPNELVARLGGPTYAWQPSGACWRPVSPSDPRTLTDVGLPYPYARKGVKTMEPRTKGNDLIVEMENRDTVWFLATQNLYGRSAKRFVTYTVDARTDQIRSIAIQALRGGSRDHDIRPHPQGSIRWWTASLRVTTLTSAPVLPTPSPLCG